MKRRTKIAFGIVGMLLLVVTVGVLALTKSEAHKLITAPNDETRELPEETPADYGLAFEDVEIESDGLRLVGWFVPSENGAVIIMQHGYKSTRKELLNEAEMLHRHGYGALITSIRAHDYSEGEQITFGMNEVRDMEAWYQYLIARDDIDPDKIGILGNSYGGMLVIQYASQNENIKAVVAHSAFSSLNDTVETSIDHFANLPAFPFAPLIVFWAERESGFTTDDIDTTKYIAQISPRPVFLMQGGADVAISPDSGQKLYDAAGEPKELWFDPALGHVDFDKVYPEEYEQRVVEFFDLYLFGQ
jgi:fermentation-respiration switch protein FrsA (DUF1100 family)